MSYPERVRPFISPFKCLMIDQNQSRRPLKEKQDFKKYYEEDI